jgi:uncharacterized membrane protein YfcA
MPEMVVLSLVGAGAGFLRGYTGFGSSMVMAPIFSLMMEPPKAVACVLALEGVITLQFLGKATRLADLRRMSMMALGAFAAIPVGMVLLVSVDAEVMRRAIGGVVMFFAVLMLLGIKFRGAGSRWATAGAGALSGLLSGSTGMGGPPAILYLLATPASAERNRANIIVFLGAIIFFTLAGLAVAGLVTREILWKVAIILPVFLLGGWAGSRMFSKSQDDVSRTVALVTLLGVGALALLS